MFFRIHIYSSVTSLLRWKNGILIGMYDVALLHDF